MKRLALLGTACGLLLVFALPASGSGSYEIFTYAQGTYGTGGTYQTTGYTYREFNRVYHYVGYTWKLRYCHTNDTCTSWYQGYANPLYDPRTDTYGRAQCNNVNDISGAVWTCQTTRPLSSSPIQSGGNEPGASAVSQMSALDTTPTVALPPSFDSAVAAVNEPSGATVPQSESVGSVNPSRVHLLMSGVGSRSVSVYAAVTNAGEVCSFETRGGGGCVSEFNHTTPVIWNGEITPSGGWTHITGLAPDRVRRVTIEEDGGAVQQAILQNNAFYVEPTGNPDAIVLTYNDGTTQTLPLSSGS
jgi:hypothetical protein